jgi:triacylglycerol lipase
MLFFIPIVLTALASSLPLISASQHSPRAPVARVKNGTYIGIHNDFYNVDYFLGMPFSQPPTGELRLALPASLNSSFETRNATEQGPGCIEFSVSCQFSHPSINRELIDLDCWF